MDKRQYSRINDNAEVYISDKAGFCTGTLKDFSRFGLCITDLPRKVHTENGFFQAVFTCSNIQFRLRVKEKWTETEGLTNIVGAVINNSTMDWTEMVMQHETIDDDVWGTRNFLQA